MSCHEEQNCTTEDGNLIPAASQNESERGEGSVETGDEEEKRRKACKHLPPLVGLPVPAIATVRGRRSFRA